MLQNLARKNVLNIYKYTTRSLFNKKEETNDFEKKLKNMNEFYKDFDKNIEKMYQQDIKNDSKKPIKPIRITYIDKRNKNAKREYYMDTGMPIDEKRNSKNEESDELSGIHDKFQEENFIDLNSKQGMRTIKLNTYRYRAEGETIKGLVYLMHGLFMHSNSIANIAKVFSKAGYEVIALDLRGHGKSGGKKGFLESPKILLDDIKQFIKQTETLGEYKNIQNKFILGYSLGGLLSSLICIEQKDHFNGMLLISPPFLDVMKDTNTYIKIARLLNNLVPSLPLMPIKRVEERKDIQEYIKNDPLIHKGRIRIGTIVTVLDSIKEHLRKIDEVKTPFFLLHGNDDKICRPEGSSMFFKEAKISDKTFLQIDNYDHFIIRHKNINNLASDMAYWMDMHLK